MIGLLNRYLGAMTPVILQHRGTINEFIGDAILVLFGAPFERPDDAERAVRCAWAMQRAMAGFNAESQALGLPSLVMGIAVHSGQVVAGNIGSQDRMKYGVVGPAVNLAGRIESLTVGPQILLSQATLDRVRPLVTVGPGSQVAVKGVPEPVTVYALRGVAGEEGMAAPDEGETLVEVDLPAVARVVGEGKRVDETASPVRVIRIGRSAVEFVASAALPTTHADLKLAIDFGDGGATDGSYVRVAAREPSDRLGPAGTRVRAVFTSLAEADLAAHRPSGRRPACAARRRQPVPLGRPSPGRDRRDCSRMAGSDRGRARIGCVGGWRAVPSRSGEDTHERCSPVEPARGPGVCPLASAGSRDGRGPAGRDRRSRPR